MSYFLTSAAIVLAFLVGVIVGHPILPRLGVLGGDIFSDTKTAVAALSALFAGFALTTQLTVGYFQSRAATLAAEANMLTAANVGHRSIASLRIQWVENLRKILSEYHAMLMSIDKFSRTQVLEISRLGTELDLMLNQSEPEQKKLWDLADKVFHLKSRMQRRKLDAKLMEAGRNVMKKEWEKIKNELRGDRIDQFERRQ